MASAQKTDQVSAILQNGDNISVYYGAAALAKAIEAAPSTGGVITLSSGNFNAVSITKAVKIFGAGFENDDANEITLTNINGNIDFNLPEAIAAPHDITLEGIYINGGITVKSAVDGLSLTKCSFKGITFNVASTRTVIKQSYIRNSIIKAHDLFVQNCYFTGEWIKIFSDDSNILLDHCIITNGTYFDNGNCKFSCTNSIVKVGYKCNVQTYNYCIIPNNNNLNGFIGSDHNWFSGDVLLADVFEDADNIDYTETRTFKLKDATKFIGSDGTQVGLYGGTYPWSKIPGTPVVKGLKTTVDGTKLKVEYKAEVR